MNFVKMPLIHHPYGFEIVNLIILVLTLGTAYVLYKKECSHKRNISFYFVIYNIL